MSGNTGRVAARAAALFTSSSNTARLSRKFAVLGVLLAGLFFALSQPRPVQAARCCQECIQVFASCENACAAQCGGTANTCYTDCWDDCYSGYGGFTSCGGSCIWCSYGGNGNAIPPQTYCEFTGPQPDGSGGFINTINCPNGYSGSCWRPQGGGEYCW